MTVVDLDLAQLDPDLERNDIAALVARRLTGTFPVDEWGLDRDLLRVVAPLARLRWELRVDGDKWLPEIGPALLVHTCRIGISEPAVLTTAVAAATDRPLRWMGGPGRGPAAPILRRLGVVPSHPADLRGLLRAGEMVGLALGRQIAHPFHVGGVPVEPIRAAIEAGAPIIPVVLVGLEVGRWWTVTFGRPISTRRSRPPGAAGDPDEVAGALRQRLQRLMTTHRRVRR